jgi:cysteine desulfurase / selenocysteine lyase
VRALIQPNTKMIIVNHVSNVLGTKQPVEFIGEIAKEHSITFLLDVSQSIGHTEVHFGKMAADIIAGSGHKGLLGPSGTGFLYVAPHVQIQPLLFGGTGILSEVLEQPEAMPVKYESGTLNSTGIWGLHAALSFLKDKGIEKIKAHQNALIRRIKNGLREIPNVKVYGDDSIKQVGIISFNVNGYLPDRIGYLLDTYFDIQVRTGLHCAPLIHPSIGTAPYGTVRVSPGYFTTNDEVDYFLSSLQTLVTRLPKKSKLKLPLKGDRINGNPAIR